VVKEEQLSIESIEFVWFACVCYISMMCAIITFGVLCKWYFSENISDNIFKLKKDLIEPDIKSLVIKSHGCLSRKGEWNFDEFK
jgi:hypothetical protein